VPFRFLFYSASASNKLAVMHGNNEKDSNDTNEAVYAPVDAKSRKWQNQKNSYNVSRKYTCGLKSACQGVLPSLLFFFKEKKQDSNK
jgi:hypothetical protein